MAQKEGTKMPKVNVNVEISRKRMSHLLCAGMEGGIGYWARIVEYIEPPDNVNIFEGFEDDWLLGSEVFRHIHYPMCEAGGGVVFEDATGEDFPSEPRVTLDYAALLRGLQVMSEKEPRHFAHFMEENEDATTGDVFIQCCVFGEVIFG